jgi:hypothetical protein
MATRTGLREGILRRYPPEQWVVVDVTGDAYWPALVERRDLDAVRRWAGGEIEAAQDFAAVDLPPGFEVVAHLYEWHRF